MNKEEQMIEAHRLGDKTKKPFLIPKEKISYMGYCFATDRILIDGCKVGYMYREEPDDPSYSGWRFLSGDESQEYVDDQWNGGLYSVNTICNYDPEIIPLLESEAGSSFARNSNASRLEEIKE
ncbi:DUF2185 domain-containing protein [Rubellicoccus peritrichatus]|uniref:DUF2185 domain-containing protein n=1 Tax=Rubellicoccus peritrichatus TaxID=3080537 RepID=A0AAQ3LBJ2_9BACT|nr:DUF2185 domain-containing protein [Puniceicoccus sp. CR14]WOO41499.1 DUF2185 domain-containing protein [Puniceicoccus sp. CR14]